MNATAFLLEEKLRLFEVAGHANLLVNAQHVTCSSLLPLPPHLWTAAMLPTLTNARRP